MKDLKIDINQFSIRYMDDLNKKKILMDES